jgi:hypothetical protein
MVQIKKTLSLATVFLISLLSVKAQYPDIPADVQKAADSLLKRLTNILIAHGL